MKKITIVIYILLIFMTGCSNTSKQENTKSFHISADEFISTYNSFIKKSPDEKIKKPSLFNENIHPILNYNGYSSVFAAETDLYDSEKGYSVIGHFNKDNYLYKIVLILDFIENESGISEMPSKGTLSAYKVLQTLDFEESDLNDATREADPSYTFENDNYSAVFKIDMSNKKFTLTFEPK
ncbi:MULTISPECIES: hypothetical protein [Bacillus]|uniref:hypothetical protein n=1 Tax=Bacillus TaxID=1386 RepID=UPI0011A04B31|nr:MULTISPECIES: hypothetical protein [Bacillus]MCP1149419.1 hypothetical protein [Bacillus sp. 1735sda2]